MADIWFYAEGGETFGPVGAGEIVERIGKAKRQPLLVWAPGMSEWTDARRLPQFAVKTPEAAPGGGKTLARRMMSRELMSYLAGSGYLLAWFCAILVYKAAILHSAGMVFAPFGLAVAKALILGALIVAPNTAAPRERKENDETLLVPTAKKALLFAIALFLLSVAEELVVGYFHGRSVKEIGGGAVTQAAATAVLMFLALLPYLAFRRLAQEFSEQFPELLFSRRAFGRRVERPDSI